MKKTEKTGGIFPLLLAAGIVAAGVFLPRFALDKQQERLLCSSGTQKEETFLEYGNEKVSEELLSARISGLTEIVAMLAGGEENSGTMRIDAREPFPAELSREDAIAAAQSFLSDMQIVFEEYGFSFFRDSSVVAAHSEEQDSSQFTYAGAVLVTSSADSGLSLWKIGLGNYAVILDAVTGIPLYLGGDVSGADVPLTKCEPYELLWIAAARAYNNRCPLGVDFYPRKTEVSTSLESRGRIHTWSWQNESCYLKVEFTEDEKKHTPSFGIWLYR